MPGVGLAARRSVQPLRLPSGLRAASDCSEQQRVLITTSPFCEFDRGPLRMLEAAGIPYVVNPLGHKLSENELSALIGDFGVLIADTEPITRRVMEQAPHLRLISRVGVGLDSVDLCSAREFGIAVSYTPDPPAPAVAEFTVGLILCALRSIPQACDHLRHGRWERLSGRRLAESTLGIIGVGRIGKRVIQCLGGLRPKRILANDLVPDLDFARRHRVEWTSKEAIYREADIICLHVPLTRLTRNLISREAFDLMRSDAILINTARGGIVDEDDLAHALRARRIAGAAIDTYLDEPYSGPLTALENCITTSHMGAMATDCRVAMERSATQEAVSLINGDALQHPVPDAEYLVQEES